MRCRNARRALLGAKEVGLLEHRASRASRHVARCVSCAAQERAARRLARDLALLRTEAPRDIDVVARVIAAIAARSAPSRSEFTWREAGWLWGATLLAGIALLGLLAARAGEFLDAAREGRVLVSGLWTAAARIVRPAEHLLGALGDAARFAWAAFSPLVGLAERLAPLMSATALATCLALLTATAIAVARDARRPQEAGHAD